MSALLAGDEGRATDLAHQLADHSEPQELAHLVRLLDEGVFEELPAASLSPSLLDDDQLRRRLLVILDEEHDPAVKAELRRFNAPQPLGGIRDPRLPIPQSEWPQSRSGFAV